jgi:hypothetical protein
MKMPSTKNGIGRTVCPAAASLARPACKPVIVVLPLMKEAKTPNFNSVRSPRTRKSARGRRLSAIAPLPSFVMTAGRCRCDRSLESLRFRPLTSTAPKTGADSKSCCRSLFRCALRKDPLVGIPLCSTVKRVHPPTAAPALRAVRLFDFSFSLPVRWRNERPSFREFCENILGLAEVIRE